MNELFTIGHSNHSLDKFLKLLRMHSISAVADIRSKPYSRHNPQFNREPLQHFLRANGVEYAFLGKELGGRSSDSSCYVDGRVQYNLVAKTGMFSEGIDRVLKGIRQFRIVLLCAEEDPITCHRTLLVSRHLKNLSDLLISHIFGNGEIETHSQAEERLLNRLQLNPMPMFESHTSLIERAYKMQSEKVAYSLKGPGRTR